MTMIEINPSDPPALSPTKPNAINPAYRIPKVDVAVSKQHTRSSHSGGHHAAHRDRPCHCPEGTKAELEGAFRYVALSKPIALQPNQRYALLTTTTAGDGDHLNLRTPLMAFRHSSIRALTSSAAS